MTDFKRILSLILLAVGIIIIGALACFISSKRAYHAGWEDAKASIKPDTEYVDKKIYIDKPVEVEVTPAGKEMYPVGTVAQLKKVIDSLAAVKPDTTLIEIPVPMETKLYRDEKDSTYEAQVTGYHATLDWIKVNQKTAYITVPIPEFKYPELIVSPSITAIAFPRNAFLGAGVDVDYWHGRWQYNLNVGYGLDVMEGENAPGMYGLVKVKYNLIRK